MSKKRFSYCILAAALILPIIGCKKENEENKAESESPESVQAAAVTQDTIRRTVAADGTLYPVNQWNVMPNITASILKFMSNRGDHVKADQLLAVLASVLLSTCGVFVALLATHATFNLSSFMVLIMVIGIVAKNGILLHDADQKFRADGIPAGEATIRAGERRLRPIMMTAMATTAGMLPLALLLAPVLRC
jgi:predicted RND superfamily exporter protein